MGDGEEEEQKENGEDRPTHIFPSSISISFKSFSQFPSFTMKINVSLFFLDGSIEILLSNNRNDVSLAEWKLKGFI